MRNGVIILLVSILVHTGTVHANGALAIDSNQGSAYGIAYDYPTMNDARARALYECGSGCTVVLTFPSGCGAYAIDQAAGSTVYGWSNESTEAQAKNRALSNCRSHGGRQCMIRAWGCNSN